MLKHPKSYFSTPKSKNTPTSSVLKLTKKKKKNICATVTYCLSLSDLATNAFKVEIGVDHDGDWRAMVVQIGMHLWWLFISALSSVGGNLLQLACNGC